MMHSYQHNIKTFNNATMHLTHVERSLYRCLIELYYDTEQPLPANDFDRLARRVLARSEDEKAALKFVLDEFFELTGDVYTHDYCDDVIEEYKRVQTSKARAGKASAEARRKKAEERKRQRRVANEQKGTDVQQVLNTCSTGVRNHKPETINHKPNNKPLTPPAGDTPDETDPTVKPESKKPGRYKFTSQHHETAVWMSNPVVQRFKNPSINLDEWADCIRKLIDLDGYTVDQITKLWRWIVEHDRGNFSWAENCRSPLKLRMRKDGVTYFEIIWQQMMREVNHAGNKSGGNPGANGESWAKQASDKTWANGLT